MDQATVDVKSAWNSKINWGELIKVAAALLATKGVDLSPEVQNDILMLIIAGGGLYTWIVRTWFTGKVTAASVTKVLILAIAATLFLPTLSRASDLSGPAAITKALSNQTPCVVGTTATPTSCSGWYAGGGIGGNGTNANIVGNGINGSVFAAGAIPFVTGGYQYVQGNWMFGVDLKGGYQTSTGQTINGVGTNTNGARFIEMFRAGGNMNALLGNQTPITVPPLLANSLLTLYAEVGSAQHQFANSWANGVASGAGALFDISNNSFLDLEYVNIQYNGAQSAGLTVPSENLLLLSYKHKF